ncbi:MAG: hypothetical protein IKP67_01480, partial [Spirochaetales bacterium]|nr:hypothetical protein [Spirochaetales bacterium]
MKRTIIVKISILCFVIFQLCSCIAVSIQDRDITAMEIQLKYHGRYADRTLVPGRVYTAEVRVYEYEKSRPIKHPDFSEFSVESNGNLEIVTLKDYKLEVRAKYPSGEWLFDDSYVLRMTIPDNEFRGAVKSYTTDWTSFHSLDYSGRNGANGTTGSSG